MKMVIAFYLESVGKTGGVNRVVSVIASKLAEYGFEVHIISRYDGKKNLFPLNERIILHELFSEFKSKYISSPIEFLRLKRIIRENNIDVLISAGATFFAIAHLIKGVRHFEWDHVSFWHGNKVLKWCRKIAARKAEKVIVLTEDNKTQFERIPGRKADVVRIFNPQTFQVEDKCDIKRKTVFSAGYIGEQKGYDLLIKAWGKIPEQSRSGWELQIAGGDEGLLESLLSYIKENNITGIKFLGFRSDIKELMLSSAIYVMSSRWEGLPMVLIEAQSLGMPIVSFNCKTGPKDILIDGTGILVEDGNINSLAQALTTLMNDTALRAQYQSNALLAANRFDVDSIAKQWVRILKS